MHILTKLKMYVSYCSWSSLAKSTSKSGHIINRWEEKRKILNHITHARTHARTHTHTHTHFFFSYSLFFTSIHIFFCHSCCWKATFFCAPSSLCCTASCRETRSFRPMWSGTLHCSGTRVRCWASICKVRGEKCCVWCVFVCVCVCVWCVCGVFVCVCVFVFVFVYVLHVRVFCAVCLCTVQDELTFTALPNTHAQVTNTQNGTGLHRISSPRSLERVTLLADSCRCRAETSSPRAGMRTRVKECAHFILCAFLRCVLVL